MAALIVQMRGRVVGGIFAGEATGYKLEGVAYGRSTLRLYAISSMKDASSTAPLLWSGRRSVRRCAPAPRA